MNTFYSVSVGDSQCSKRGYVWIYTLRGLKVTLCESKHVARICYWYTAWFKMMDTISYVYFSRNVEGKWMTYITFKRGGHILSNIIARVLERSPSAQPCSSVIWEQNGYYTAQYILRSSVHYNSVGDCCAPCVSSSFQHSTSNEEEHLSLESPNWANRLSVKRQKLRPATRIREERETNSRTFWA